MAMVSRALHIWAINIYAIDHNYIGHNYIGQHCAPRIERSEQRGAATAREGQHVTGHQSDADLGLDDLIGAVDIVPAMKRAPAPRQDSGRVVQLRGVAPAGCLMANIQGQ